MRRSGILHAELARQISLLGHTDTFVIGDCGLPLPRDMPVIDLALADGQIAFEPVLDAVLAEVVVQGHVLAQETEQSPAHLWFEKRRELLGARTTVSHEQLKTLVDGCVFAIRTGERTAYANVILEAGVAF